MNFGLPEQLARRAARLTSARKALRSTCPWHKAPVQSRPRKSRGLRNVTTRVRGTPRAICKARQKPGSTGEAMGQGWTKRCGRPVGAKRKNAQLVRTARSLARYVESDHPWPLCHGTPSLSQEITWIPEAHHV